MLARGAQRGSANQEFVCGITVRGRETEWTFGKDPRTGDTKIDTAELDRTGAFGDWPEDFDEVHLDAEASYLDAAAEAARR